MDLGATYNFITQAVADWLGPVVAQKSKPPSPIAAVYGKPLRATTFIRQIVCMRDNAGTNQSHAINFVVADIAHDGMILGMAWL